MSQQQATQFLSDLNENDNLQQQLKDYLDIETGDDLEAEQQQEQILKQIIDFATHKGYEFTAEDYQSVIEEKRDELSDDELEAVAGGGTYQVMVSVLTYGAACAIATIDSAVHDRDSCF